MITYNPSFDPPAPTLTIKISGVIRRRPWLEIDALLDTGSDMTAIPLEILERLRLSPFSRVQVEGIQGGRQIVYTYAVKIAWINQPGQEMEVIATPMPLAVLGRDWLQRYYLWLNGPEQQFAIGLSPLASPAP